MPGVSNLTAHAFLSEVGPDLCKFRNGPALAFWLGLCPDNRINGGRILSAKTRKVTNRLSVALRKAAQSLHCSQSRPAQHFCCLRTRLGAPATITAAIHKLAGVLYHITTTRQPYDESIFAGLEARARDRQFVR